MTTETNSSFDQWASAKDIARDFPHIWSESGLIREARQRDFNGMKDAQAVAVFRHKLRFHRERLAQWWEGRYAKSA